MTKSLPEIPARPPSSFRGERLRELREAKGFDVETLAKRLAVSPAQLRQLESNQSSLFYSEAIRLAVARKVSEFLGETLVIDSPEATLAALASPQICVEPRKKLDPETPFGLTGCTAALGLVALSFAVLLGLQGYQHARAIVQSDLTVARATSQPTADVIVQN